tara:strand:+ start:2236 stop:3429 length:1194 start_codon:yes stop_codon:yes gene_type:complete
MKFFNSQPDKERYFFATYEIEVNCGFDLRKASWELAIGQSVGNPNVRNKWENDELFEQSSCIICHEEESLSGIIKGLVTIGFPVINTDWSHDSVTHLLCQVMGGQVDIGTFKKCRLIKLDLPKKVEEFFAGPKYGINGFRKFTGIYHKPFSGAIVKPKTGISPATLLQMVKELVDGGVDFIKEDEILSNPIFCKLEDRVELISNYINNCGRKIVYCFCINGDHDVIANRANFVYQNGGNGIHLNIWSGLGGYKAIRNLDLPIFIHFQKSGDRVLTDPNNNFGIDWNVICDLAGLIGVDSIHAGMWGGYLNEDEKKLRATLDILKNRNVCPALSCGMHPGLVNKNKQLFGSDFIANVGGAIHGHPDGTLSGAKAMRQAIDESFGIEYKKAIDKWGLIT